MVPAKLTSSYCIQVGFCSYLNVATALIIMYANAGFIDLGHKIVYQVPQKDVRLWNCLIDGYVRNGTKFFPQKKFHIEIILDQEICST